MDTSYLSLQVSNIVTQLHGLFDEIGIPSHERESRESELFAALSETLHNHVCQVNTEKSEITEEAQRIITTIKQMEASLDDNKQRNEYEAEDEDLKLYFPLSKCLQGLKEKHVQISRLHKERSEQVKKLVEALESYSSHLEPTFVKIELPPTAPGSSIPPGFDLSSLYITALDDEFTHVYEEYTRRITTVKTLSEQIIQSWAELGTPQALTDASIVKYYRDAPEQLGLLESDITRLRLRRDKLAEEKKSREKRLKDLKATVASLWDRLGVEEQARKVFLNSNRGCGVRQINEFEDELSRLNELKRQNLHLFVEDARYKLQELWDDLYFSEEEMLEFTPAFSDVYSDALLEAHEREICRLEALKEQRAPTLALVDEHRSLVKDRDDLQASSQDASRLMMRGQKGEKRDPTRLLREEKMRKRIAKDLPRIALKLRKALETWEEEYSRPFLVHGDRYLAELDASEARPAPGPRSKTPAGPPQKLAKNAKSAPPSRGNSVRGAPPSRAGARTPIAGGTITKNPFAASVSVNGTKSPTKIPSRPPLSHLVHGQNSPERQAVRPEFRQDNNSTIRGKMPPPPRAPPPRMRDLFVPPPAPTPISHFRPQSVMSSGSVRHVSPEDVYDDRFKQLPSSRAQSYYESQASMRQEEQFAHSNPYPVPASRQISNTSAATTTVSGSENWETYDDVSEPEQDVPEGYHAKLRTARGKRFTPEGGYSTTQTGQHKKHRGIPPSGGYPGQGVTTDFEGRIISGSEANWTDEDAF